MIRKIWTDPVWSKVIAVGVITFITLCYTKFLSVSKNLSFQKAFEEIVEIKISVVYILIILVAYFIISWLFKRIFKKEKAYYNSKQIKLRTFNKIADPNAGMLFKWSVFFDYNTPFISDLTAFCTKHGEVPIRFTDDSCSINDCEHSRLPINKEAVKNYIESLLIDKWEKMN